MATENLQIAHGDHDAYEAANGTVTVNAASIGNVTTGNQWAGFGFGPVTIPQGSIVSSAIFQMYALTTANDTIVADIYAEGTYRMTPAFTADANNISSRSLTSAKASVNASNVGVGWYSVDVTSVIQEKLSYPEQPELSTQAFVIILDGLPGIAWNCRAYEGDPSLAAKLDITYTPPAVSGQPPRSMHQFAQRRVRR